MAGPSFRAAPVRVRVPATSANLGPGFDALGLALALHDDVVVRVGDSGLVIDVAGEGADDVPRDRRHLVVRALRAAFDLLGGQPRGLEIVCANRIPHGRGLGSSAAAIVAGITAARHLVLGGIPDEAVLALATEMEGHPDNVAACLYGGLTIAWREVGAGGAAGGGGAVGIGGAVGPGGAVGAGGVAVTRLEPHPDIAPVVFLPGTRSSTAKARRLLPETVPHADAAVTAGRAALLVEALTRQPDLLLPATYDMLHQPYRAASMPRTAALVEALRAAGVPAVVSGAGPSVLALATGATVEAVLRHPAGRGWVAQPLAVDYDGARVVPLAGG